MAVYNHPKVLPVRGEQHIHSIHDAARAMKEIKAEHTQILSVGKEIGVHRTKHPDAPIKERRVKRDGEWVWEKVR